MREEREREREEFWVYGGSWGLMRDFCDFWMENCLGVWVLDELLF